VRFDLDTFIDDCTALQRESDQVGAIADLVERQVRHGPKLDDALVDGSPGPLTLYASPELTVQRIEWPAGFHGAPHDHRMWAVVGVYVGSEHNNFHRRGPDGLVDAGGRVIEQGSVLALDTDAIHSVANPSRESVLGLHVYGGDIDGVPRSQWRPDGTEGPLAEVRAESLSMWAAVREFLSEASPPLSDDQVFEAISAINEQMRQRQRTLAHDEIRDVLTALGSPDTE